MNTNINMIQIRSVAGMIKSAKALDPIFHPVLSLILSLVSCFAAILLNGLWSRRSVYWAAQVSLFNIACQDSLS